MDSKTEVLVAMGAAIGANCIPCFDHLYGRSKEVGLDDGDIQDVARVAERVKGGAALFIRKAVSDAAGKPEDEYEPCGCPSGGGCA